MRETFHHELTRIDDTLIRMTSLVRAAMAAATTALLTADLPLAESVISGDARIDGLREELEERAFDVLARQQPVAVDLRSVLASMRIVSSLERMGDLARHVASIARMRYPDQAVPAPIAPLFAEMAAVADAVAAKAGEVLRTHDIAMAAELQDDDDRMDALHKELFTRIRDDWTYGMESAVDLTLLARFHERFADHAVSLGRRVVQLVTGELPVR